MAADVQLVEMVTAQRFRIGDYLVEPDLDRISLDGEVTSVRPQVMELLVYLASRPGKVFAAEELISELWPRKVVTNASLYNCVAELRRALAGNEDRPSLIQTIPKRGYRLVGDIRGLEPPGIGTGRPPSREVLAKKPAVAWAPVAVLVVFAIAYFAVGRMSVDEAPTPVERGDLKPFIAVLPFKDLSPTGNQAYFAEGLAEELINSLAQIGELQVAARSTSFALADAGLSGTELAERLKLTHLLEGSVRKDGDRLRITAQLIDARSSAHLWSSSYDRRLDDALAVQREISDQVARELEMRVSDPARTIASPDPQALEWVLEGRQLLSQRHLDGLKRAESLFTQATEIDPDYADAYAGLAKSLVLRRGIYEWGDLQLIDRARVALDRALEIDPHNSNALATKGLMLVKSDSEAAKKLYQQAIESNPSNSDAYRWLALSCEQTEPLRYLDSIRKAYLVDPLNHSLNFHRVVSLARFGLYDEALDAVRDWRRLNPLDPGSFALAGQIHFSQGIFDQALESYYRAYQIDPDWIAPAFRISELLIELNQLELAEGWLTVGQGHESSSQNEGRFDMVQRVMLAEFAGQNEAASAILSQVQEPDPYWSLDVGRALALVNEDLGSARVAWERGLTELGWNDHGNRGAPNLIDYSLVLERTGALDEAAELADEAELLIETQLAAGMVKYGEWESFHAGVQFYAAALHAMRGEKERTMEMLVDDGSGGSEPCVSCLKSWPHFDSLRNDPDFEALLMRLDAERTAQSQNLTERGLLLTPDEVLAFEDANFGVERLAVEP